MCSINVFIVFIIQLFMTGHMGWCTRIYERCILIINFSGQCSFRNKQLNIFKFPINLSVFMQKISIMSFISLIGLMIFSSITIFIKMFRFATIFTFNISLNIRIRMCHTFLLFLKPSSVLVPRFSFIWSFTSCNQCQIWATWVLIIILHYLLFLKKNFSQFIKSRRPLSSWERLNKDFIVLD